MIMDYRMMFSDDAILVNNYTNVLGDKIER